MFKIPKLFYEMKFRTIRSGIRVDAFLCTKKKIFGGSHYIYTEYDSMNKLEIDSGQKIDSKA